MKSRSVLFDHLKDRLENGWLIIEDTDSSVIGKLRKDGIDFETVKDMPGGSHLARKTPELRQFLRSYSCLLPDFRWKTLVLVKFITPVGEVRKSAILRSYNSQPELTGLIKHIME